MTKLKSPYNKCNLMLMTTADADKWEKPKASKGDVAHTAIKASLAAIPIVGGSAAELFSTLLTPPLVKRRDDWVESIANGLQELKQTVEGFSIENLSKNEAFITTVFYATTIAIRNHQQEKLEALRNAVLNTALTPTIDENQTQIFLNYIDYFTPWHIKILDFFQDPKSWGQKHDIVYPDWTFAASSTVLEHTFAELRDRRNFYDQIVKDLSNRGLMHNGNALHAGRSSSSIFGSLTTTIGNEFLKYIRSPTV